VSAPCAMCVASKVSPWSQGPQHTRPGHSQGARRTQARRSTTPATLSGQSRVAVTAPSSSPCPAQPLTRSTSRLCPHAHVQGSSWHWATRACVGISFSTQRDFSWLRLGRPQRPMAGLRHKGSPRHIISATDLSSGCGRPRAGAAGCPPHAAWHLRRLAHAHSGVRTVWHARADPRPRLHDHDPRAARHQHPWAGALM